MPAHAVFVSSTSKDLENHRAVASQVILDMGWTPRMMEHFSAMTTTTVEACREKLATCQVMLLIVAFRQGWVPTAEQDGNGVDSVTALELQFARKRKIPVVAMLAKETWPGNLWEEDADARAWVRKFRDELNLPAAFFEFEAATTKESERLPIFRATLRGSLVDFREQELARQAPQASAGGSEHLDAAIFALRSGRCIPFLGSGMFGNGPLSTDALIGALGKPDSDGPSLATSAEYRERKALSRADFLHDLETILSGQARAVVGAAAVHDLLRQFKPPLIVSATCDLSLEERLEAEGHRPFIFCHVIRSQGGEHDGKVMVFRGTRDASPQFLPADKIELGEMKDQYIIYKPQGSPLLHRNLDSDLGIDTVVLTESDHLVFFGRLKNQATSIPTAFSRYFQRYPFIFLGYPMDVWHYRLIAHVFGSTDVKKSFTSLTVRVPASQMESLAWRRLGIDVLAMDANELARKALTVEPSQA